MRTVRWPYVLILALALLGARGAPACPARLGPQTLPERTNNIEASLGGTNANAAVGAGGLTATVSRCGEITSLKWPGPSFWDQMQYVTSNADDARARDHLGALPSMGAFAGLAWETKRGRGFTWLRDAAWTAEQDYTSSTSGVVRTTYRHEGLGLVVVGTTFVLPGRDVLVNRFRVERDPRSAVRRARLIFYANLAPTRKRVQWFPVGDTGLDYRNDFAVLYDARREAFLHFLPGEDAPGLTDLIPPESRDFALLNPLLQDPPDDPDALQAAVHGAVDALDGPGVYLAAGAAGGDDGFQMGFDDAPLCSHQSGIAERTLGAFGLSPEFIALAGALFVCNRRVSHPDGPLGACRDDNGWTWSAESAWRDAQDGGLSGSPLAACHANAALARDLHFRGHRAEATFYVSAAGTRDQAFALLQEARGGGSAQSQQQAAERWWEEWLAPARLPDTGDREVLRFARRALASLRTATDARTGAMVASVAAQPPYGLDWPRDGAFLNYALDLAGYTDLVTRHNLLYTRWQRKDWQPWSIAFSFSCDLSDPSYPGCVPPGTFEMNYYAVEDPAIPGGPFSFEIDTTGLAVWTLWDHARFLQDAGERRGYLDAVCPAVALGADALAGCDHPDDPDPRLQCLANEDDNAALTQGLQGAETTLLAIKSAIEAAPDCGFAAEAVARWTARRDVLEEAILDTFLVTEPSPGFPGPRFLGGRRAWVIWPTRLLPFFDPRMRSHAEFITQESVEPVLARSALQLGYNSQNMLARAQLARALGDGAALAEIEEQVRFFVRHGTTPGTLHMAEFAGRVPLDLDGDGTAPDYLPENDVPHVWQQAFLYATAMVAFGSRPPAPLRCDADGDGSVDRGDLAAIRAARGTAARDLLDPRDADEDGTIGIDDLHACRARCPRPGCSPEPPPRNDHGRRR